jgi:hypothetical protein
LYSKISIADESIGTGRCRDFKDVGYAFNSEPMFKRADHKKEVVFRVKEGQEIVLNARGDAGQYFCQAAAKLTPKAGETYKVHLANDGMVCSINVTSRGAKVWAEQVSRCR